MSLLEPGSLVSVAHHAWTTGPQQPRLIERSVHVWRVELSTITDELSDVLDAGEHVRAECLVRGRRLWPRARAVLRVLAGRYLQSDPRALRFVSGPSGKPALPHSQLSFNLSHSGSLALYAFTTPGEVGVDVELANRPIDAVALAERAFDPSEARRLEAFSPSIRRREFLRRWTRHEAELKRRGIGLGGQRASSADGGHPWIASLDVGPQAVGALAVGAAPHELLLWDWPGEGAAGNLTSASAASRVGAR
jgi:4'-phosphopantetheinyl transferase